jgi:hypothetical protein
MTKSPCGGIAPYSKFVTNYVSGLGLAALTIRDLPHICVGINDMEFCALIDSWSSVTVISAQAYNDLCSKFKLGPLKPVAFNCHTASSQPLEFSGFFHHKIRIHRFTWYINILVADNLPTSMILGSDFISKSGLLLDLRINFCIFHFVRMTKFLYVTTFNILRLCTMLLASPLFIVIR